MSFISTQIVNRAMDKNLNPIIGLEVHTQLDTDTKLFCPCSTDIENKSPNSNVCPTCLGLPGGLPRVNESAIEKAIIATDAIDGEVAEKAHFDRKHYFYPDLPRGFQITQNEEPLCEGGKIEVEDKIVEFYRAHIEEDPGSISYDGNNIKEADRTKIDYNRSGIPLMEFVTKPHIESPQEARKVVENLVRLLDYIQVIDRTNSSAVRVDANVSLKSDEGITTARTEIKNIGSPSEVKKALSYEVSRQKDSLRRQKEQTETTRHWDDTRGITQKLREKEQSEDYRYIKEYDIPEIRTF